MFLTRAESSGNVFPNVFFYFLRWTCLLFSGAEWSGTWSASGEQLLEAMMVQGLAPSIYTLSVVVKFPGLQHASTCTHRIYIYILFIHVYIILVYVYVNVYL